jgi:dienelactone hydrolase
MKLSRDGLLLLVGCAFFFALGASAKDQEFRFEKADAQSVGLAGEFNNWKAQAMTKESDGVWIVTVSLSPGTYGYKFLVNGSDWVFDPKNPNRKTVDGIENSVIDVTVDTATSTIPRPTSIPARTPLPAAARSLPSSPTATSTNTPSAASLSPTPGEILRLEVPLSEKRRAEAAKDGNSRLAHAKMAIAVPQNFDPQKSWPVLVISNTEAYSNIDSMQQFKQAALDEGWVIMAADAVEAEKNKEGGSRWPTIAAAFDYITGAWPAAKDWLVATGGMSGGAKNSAFLAADLAREHHRMIGMLMMGCNQDMASVAFHKSAPPAFLGVPIFLSSGTSDTIASPGQHEAVKNSLKATGFQKVRLESHAGGHDIFQPHINEALRWFTAEANKSAPTGPQSDFDKFFKKKP